MKQQRKDAPLTSELGLYLHKACMYHVLKATVCMSYMLMLVPAAQFHAVCACSCFPSKVML